MVADVVDYTRLMGEDEARTLAALNELRENLFQPALAARKGDVIKRMGDGWIVEFTNVSEAVACAIDIQERLSGHAIIRLRIGVHIGEVTFQDDDRYGDGINVAARLETLAQPGHVLISDTVHQSLDNKATEQFAGGETQQLKNITRPVGVWRWPVGSDLDVASSDDDDTTPLPLPDKPSIAVLPFDNMSCNPEQEYFADGIAEDIITSLSRLSGFFVIARNSTFTFKDQAINVKAVARELGVRYVLEGSVRKAANRVRVTAQLIDGESGNHVWAERYDRELADIFAVQDEITETIVGAIAPKLHVAEITRSQDKAPSNLDAWDLVMQAIDRISRFTDTDSREAIALLDRAIVLDPGYARAYAHKAWLTIWRAFQGWDPMEKALPSASESVAKGRQFDADEPWIYVARIMVCMASLEGSEAVAAARKAVELNPNFAYGYSFLGVALATSGDGKAAISAIDRAVRLSPRDLLRDEFELFYGFAHFQMGNYAEAADYAASAISLRPGHAYPYRILAASSALAGDQKRAVATIEEILGLTPGLNIALATMQSVFVPDDDRERFINGLRKAGLPE
jgi:TolB-like protein